MRFNKVIKMLLIIFSSVLAFVLVIIIFLLIKSPGKPEQHLDFDGKPSQGAISEKIFVSIGGVKQGMFIQSKNINNPVLLYLHGGPSFPNYFLIDKYKPGLEDYFTVCYWEQRGGGLSFNPEVTSQSMTFEQLTNDALEVTNYLRERFDKEKIFLMAHSGGTVIGLMSVAKAPQLFHAYVAMAQITNQAESEKRAYQYMLDTYTSLGNKKRVNELLRYKMESDSNVLNFYKSGIRDEAMHELGIGTMHNMKSIFRDIFIPVWTCKAYTLQEKINIWKSKFSFLPNTTLYNETIERNFSQEITSVDIPVYFVSGKHDLTVNIDLSREYFNKLNAPIKGFYTFEKSAHSPIYEEPKKLLEILVKDVLSDRMDLADKAPAIVQ
jgi:pimeloyl-ACP methyl ester carboxylesterase